MLKMQIPRIVGTKYVLCFASVSLATIGVCVLCAITSVVALFLFLGGTYEKIFIVNVGDVVGIFAIGV